MGSLTLILMEVVLTGPANHVTGVFGQVTLWLAEWMDPAIPLVPDHRPGAKAPSKTQVGLQMGLGATEIGQLASELAGIWGL